MTVTGSLHVGLTLIGVYLLIQVALEIPHLLVFASAAQGMDITTGAMWVGTLGPWFFRLVSGLFLVHRSPDLARYLATRRCAGAARRPRVERRAPSFAVD